MIDRSVPIRLNIHIQVKTIVFSYTSTFPIWPICYDAIEPSMKNIRESIEVVVYMRNI